VVRATVARSADLEIPVEHAALLLGVRVRPGAPRPWRAVSACAAAVDLGEAQMKIRYVVLYVNDAEACRTASGASRSRIPTDAGSR
jgi:hypothetical protein